MTHCALADGDFEVCEWTGDVPRVCETLAVLGHDGLREISRWEVTDVVWVARARRDGIVDTLRAAILVKPASEGAEAWLGSVRRERATSGAERPRAMDLSTDEGWERAAAGDPIYVSDEESG